MSVETWIALGVFVVSLIGIAVHVERRMGKALTRDEHDEICKERNATVQRSLDRLRDDMETRHGENRKSFDKIETATTGTHQLIVDIYRDLLNQKPGGR